MRENLFRGKRADNDEWVGGILLADDVIVPCGQEFEVEGCTTVWENLIAYVVIPETVGQYTGLTDKNGRKIFEGDILCVEINEYKDEDNIVFGKMKTRTGHKVKTTWSVEYKEHRCQGNGFFAYGKDRRFHLALTKSVLYNANAEIIGNIHDNPELLKGGAEE